VYYAKYNTIKQNIMIFFGYFMFIFFGIFIASFSYRFGLYYEAFGELWYHLNNGIFTVGTLEGQMVNIVPIWDLWLKLSAYNPIPLLFGHGYGSASVVNSSYLMIPWGDPVYEVSNPHSQVIRNIFEGGIVGTLLFISLFLSPFKKIIIRKEDYKKFILVMLLVLSAFFSHRTVAPFVLFGMASVIFTLIRNEFMNKANYSKILDKK
jgi:hypothetical protein